MGGGATINLLAHAKSQSWRGFFYCWIALGGSIVVTIIGVFTLFMWVIGALGILASIILMPITLYAALVPTSAFDISELGDDKDARLHWVYVIEQELAHPQTFSIPGKDGTVYLTANWFVYIGKGELTLAPRAQVHSIWEELEKDERKIKFLCHARDGEQSFDINEHDVHIIGALHQAMPHTMQRR